jgi:hypothetical protein
MIILPIISIILFTTFLVYVYKKFGKKLTTLSKSYYLLGDKWWIFTITMMLFPVPLLFTMKSGFLFLSVVGVMFAGVAGKFKDKPENVLHIASAVISIVAAMIYITFTLDTIVPLIIFGILSVLAIVFVDNYGLWVEIFGFYIPVITIMIDLF